MSCSLALTFSFFLVSLGACSSARGDQAGGETVDTSSAKSSTRPQAIGVQPDPSLSVAYLAGGCFWCTEASFERIKGVQTVVSGYSGGTEKNPTYEQVSSGRTSHAEAIAVYYDSSIVSFRTLLDVFFVAHDPTTLNRQGPDVGPQYRSAIFFQSPREQALANAVIDSVNASKRYSNPIVTELSPFDNFYEAEDYHQNYYALHPDQSYVYNVSRPKVEKVVKEFKGIVKEEYK